MTFEIWSRRLATAWALARLVPAFVALGVLKRVVALPVLAKWAWRAPVGSADRGQQRHIISRVLRAGRLSGFPDRDCLQRSLLLYRALSRAGAEPTLVVGFRRNAGELQGHAWVIMGGEVIAEDPACISEFTPAFSFGSHGCLLPSQSDPPPRLTQLA